MSQCLSRFVDVTLQAKFVIKPDASLHPIFSRIITRPTKSMQRIFARILSTSYSKTMRCRQSFKLALIQKRACVGAKRRRKCSNKFGSRKTEEGTILREKHDRLMRLRQGIRFRNGTPEGSSYFSTGHSKHQDKYWDARDDAAHRSQAMSQAKSPRAEQRRYECANQGNLATIAVLMAAPCSLWVTCLRGKPNASLPEARALFF